MVIKIALIILDKLTVLVKNKKITKIQAEYDGDN